MARRRRSHLPDSTLGERVADYIGHIIGSWLYIGSTLLGFAAWVAHNVLSGHPFDPWPCIVLGLLISIATYVQESIMLMAQNRASRQMEHLAIDTNRQLREALESIQAAEVLLTFLLRAALSEERPSDGGHRPGSDLRS